MIPHGTRNHYDKGCRCNRCKLAASMYYSKPARMERTAARMRAANSHWVHLRQAIAAKRAAVRDTREPDVPHAPEQRATHAV